MKRLLIIIFMCIFFTSCSSISNFQTKVIAGATSDIYILAQIENKDKLNIKVFKRDDNENCIDEYESPFINRKKIIVGITYDNFIRKYGNPVHERILGENEKEIIYFQKFYSKFRYGIDNRIIKIHLYKGIADFFEEEYVPGP